MHDASKNLSRSTKILSGFTLIELLLTISIVGVLSIFGVVTYREYNQGKTLETAAQDIQNTLVLARSRASTQVKPEISACSSGRELYGYRVDFCQNNCSASHNYQLAVVCGESGQYSEYVADVETLPTGVTFTSTQPQSILFRVLTGEVTGASSLGMVGFGDTRTVSVSPTGVVTVSQ